jgi:hypothetical protein
MKIRLGLILAIFTFMVGCAPGYYAEKSAYPAGSPAIREMGKGYENPETSSEQEDRIWSEESGR